MTLLGRDAELRQLVGLVKRPRGRYAVVCGPDGIGKTALLGELAARVDLSEMWIPWCDKESMAFHVMDALGVLREDSATLWEALAAWRRWLLVVEDVERPDDVRAMVERLAEHPQFGRAGQLVVATSWDDDARAWGPRAEIIRLDSLSLNDAVDLLLETAPGGGDRVSAKVLAEKLREIPMLLRVAGWAIAESRQTFDDYREPFADVVEWSLDRLAEEGLPLARAIMRMLSLVADAPLPRDVINADLLARVDEEVTAEDVNAALAGLHRYRLVSTDELPILSLVVHTTVRAYVDEPLDLRRWRATLDDALLAAAEAAADAGRAGWVRGDLLAPHLVPIAGRNSDSWDTLDRLALAMNAAGRPSQVMLRRAVLEADHSDVNTRRHNLALALIGVGDYQAAVDLYRQVPAGYERDVGLAQALDKLGAHREAAELLEQLLATLDRDDPETWVACGNLGVVSYNLGDHRRAADLHQRALAGFEDFYGPDHPETLTSRGNLGVAMLALGDRHEAGEILQQNLADRERVLGPDHPDTRLDRSWLAAALAALEESQQ